MAKLLDWDEKYSFNNDACLSKTFRICIIGSSGVGKTNLILDLLIKRCPIHKTFFLDYNVLVICSPSISQMKYQAMIKGFNKGLNKDQLYQLYQERENIKNLDKALEEMKNDLPIRPIFKVITFNNTEQLIMPEVLRKNYPNEKILLLIDDSMNSDLTIVEKYFSYSRALGINVIFISQGYTKIKKTSMREQVNIFILFKQSLSNIKTV